MKGSRVKITLPLVSPRAPKEQASHAQPYGMVCQHSQGADSFPSGQNITSQICYSIQKFFSLIRRHGLWCILTQINWLHQAPETKLDWKGAQLKLQQHTRNLQKGSRRVLNSKQTVQSCSQLAQGRTSPTGPTTFMMGWNTTQGCRVITQPAPASVDTFLERYKNRAWSRIGPQAGISPFQSFPINRQ